ncbi:MAG: hypothetical protein B6U72_03210 [Candidatus Altiarchaeales archaeon ex4484_2]|nr:MAG: hypothetical protein B6U72_03210 [Candidatus Altiarchaeales archaeon ex4484_2]
MAVEGEDLVLKAVIVASIAGILLVSGLVFFAEKPSEKGFTELYFEDPDGLPTSLQVNESYKVSFTVVSHEKNPVDYVYRVVSPSFNDSEVEWVLSRSRSRQWRDELDLSGDSWIVRSFDLESIGEGNTTSSIIQWIHNLSLSDAIRSYGIILLKNVSLVELGGEPLREVYYYSDLNNGILYKTVDERVLFVDNGSPVLDRSIRESWFNQSKKQFSVSLSTGSGESYGIHFWYTVRE